MATYDDLLEQGDDILAADTLAPAGSDHKLPPALRGKLKAALALADARQDTQGMTEGARRAASTQVKAAYEDGEKLVRQFNRFVNNLNDSQDEKIDIAALRASYELGRVVKVDMTHAYVKNTLQHISRVAPSIQPPSARPRASVLARITEILTTLNAQGVSAGIGDRSSITTEKDAAMKALEELIARVRYFLWSSLPGMFKDPLLHNYGFVPRQESETEREEAPTAAVAGS